MVISFWGRFFRAVFTFWGRFFRAVFTPGQMLLGAPAHRGPPAFQAYVLMPHGTQHNQYVKAWQQLLAYENKRDILETVKVQG